ncbi:hypothetical protein CTAYLR_007420 [Chrysophaeum taylorii]|uniref:Dynactin subunit 6 n=1 Tax=Chrysophaeum taylorii TaxID=2483200 RepID=A0AAD7U4E6_9STRA|nr:hypothetical protein CTAYLR_007420 [Chrysophaeum taylorii]
MATTARCVVDESARIEGVVQLGEDNVVEEGVEISNTSAEPLVIGRGNRFEAGCVVRASVGDYNVFKARCVVEAGVEIGSGCCVGATVRLREGTYENSSVWRDDDVVRVMRCEHLLDLHRAIVTAYVTSLGRRGSLR